MEIKVRPILNHNPKRWDNFFLKCVGVQLPEDDTIDEDLVNEEKHLNELDRECLPDEY